MNFIVGGCVLAAVILAARSLWKDHRSGKSCSGCDGDCAHCGMHRET